MSMTVAVRGFGPIRSGSVSIGPLTVFLGPNNTGKSYFAMLMYALTHASPTRALDDLIPWDPNWVSPYTDFSRPVPEDAGEVIELVRKRRGYRRGLLGQTTLGELRDLLSQRLAQYTDWWKSEIERCFGQELPELVQPHRRGNCVTISHSEPDWHVKIVLRTGDVEVITAPDPESVLTFAMEDARSAKRLPGVRGPTAFDVQHFPPQFVWNVLLQTAISACFRGFPPSAYYLPAARSGILQSHKTLTSLLWRRASRIGVEDLRVPTMTGVLTDFISLLLNLSGRRPTELAEIAGLIETGVLRGQVHIKSTGDYPEIAYEGRYGRHQLHTTSSMVSEMAPVVLFLRHYVRPGDILIIEEPESHLHPSIQREVARVIARLVNKGVLTVVTTHSDYFMTQLNNLITASELSEKERHQAGLQSDDCLAATLVSAYLFDPTSQDSTRVRPLPVDRVHGIPLQEFTAVAEGLYNQTLSLESSALDAP